MVSDIPTRFVSVSVEEAKPHPVKLDVKLYSGKEGRFHPLDAWRRNDPEVGYGFNLVSTGRGGGQPSRGKC